MARKQLNFRECAAASNMAPKKVRKQWADVAKREAVKSEAVKSEEHDNEVEVPDVDPEEEEGEEEDEVEDGDDDACVTAPAQGKRKHAGGPAGKAKAKAAASSAEAHAFAGTMTAAQTFSHGGKTWSCDVCLQTSQVIGPRYLICLALPYVYSTTPLVCSALLCVLLYQCLAPLYLYSTDALLYVFEILHVALPCSIVIALRCSVRPFFCSFTQPCSARPTFCPAMHDWCFTRRAALFYFCFTKLEATQGRA